MENLRQPLTTATPLRKERLFGLFDQATGQLLLLALISFAVYGLAFLRFYGLPEWWASPHLDISKITHHDPRGALAYLIAMCVLFGVYWLAARNTLGRRDRLAWSIVIAGAVAFNVVLLLLYPVDAVDIFDNIIRGRMLGTYGSNPFYVTPSQIPNDPFYPYAGWYDATSAYGPGWEIIAAVLARLSGDSILLNVIAFKLASIAAYAGTALLIVLTLRRFAPERALYGLLLFAWNPLVVYVTAGNGHNDSVMVFFIVLAFYFLSRGRFTLSALAATAGALIKFIPALLLPLILLAALKRLQSWRQRISFLLITAGACQALVFGSLLPFFQGGDMIGVTRRTEMFTTSLPTWGVILLERWVDSSTAQLLASRAALVVLGLWVLRELFVLWRRDRGAPMATTWPTYVGAGLSVLLFYLLVSCLWFQPWYVIWAVALAALLPQGVMTGGALLLSFVATWKMPIFDFYIFATGYLPPMERRELPLTAGTLGAAWLYFLYHLTHWNPLARRNAGEGALDNSTSNG